MEEPKRIFWATQYTGVSHKYDMGSNSFTRITDICMWMCVSVCVKADSQAPFLTCESESLGQSPGICIQHPGSDPLRGAQGLEPWALLQSWAVRTSLESEMRHTRDGVGGWRTASQGPSGAADQCCRQLWATAYRVRAPSGVNICPFTSELRPAKGRPDLGRGAPLPTAFPAGPTQLWSRDWLPGPPQAEHGSGRASTPQGPPRSPSFQVGVDNPTLGSLGH